MPPRRPFLIGVAGPSCSGKTEVSRRLAVRLRAPIVALDSYYRDLSHLSQTKRAAVNFDEPQALDHPLLIRHIGQLAAGRPIDKPVYDFAQHARTAAVEHVEPADFVIVEGLFTLYWARLRKLLGVRVFLEVPDDLCFERRATRDVRERGRTPESVYVQYNATVRPMAGLYVLPTRRYADLVISGGDSLDATAETVLQFIDKATGAARAS